MESVNGYAPALIAFDETDPIVCVVFDLKADLFTLKRAFDRLSEDVPNAQSPHVHGAVKKGPGSFRRRRVTVNEFEDVRLHAIWRFGEDRRPEFRDDTVTKRAHFEDAHVMGTRLISGHTGCIAGTCTDSRHQANNHQPDRKSHGVPRFNCWRDTSGRVADAQARRCIPEAHLGDGGH